MAAGKWRGNARAIHRTLTLPRTLSHFPKPLKGEQPSTSFTDYRDGMFTSTRLAMFLRFCRVRGFATRRDPFFPEA